MRITMNMKNVQIFNKRREILFKSPYTHDHKYELQLRSFFNFAVNKSRNLSDLENVFYDVLVFFSPSGIKSLKKNFPNFIQNNTRIAAFGKTTIKAAKEVGLKVNIEAPTKTAPSMSMALEQYLNKVNKKK